MPVIRTAHNDDYTVMSNYHLRDRNLSLKAKGLLSLMLSLPDDWNYTLAGLASINRESKDAIRSALVELEKAGYIERHQTVDSRGKFSRSEYVVYERPQSVVESSVSEETTSTEESSLSEKTTSAEKTTDSTMLEKSTTESATAENATQLNKDIQNKEKQNTDFINPSLPFLQVSREESDDGEEAKRKEMSAEEIENYREVIRYNIDYDVLVDDHPDDKSRLDEVVELLTETVCSKKKFVRIGGNDYPTEAVKARLLQLDMYHIKFVFDCMSKNKTKIRNIRQYLLTALYNAPSTIENYYSAMVNHDLYGED